MPTTPATTTPASPERYPRYCVECGEGMRTGYQHEEDTNLTYCSLECAADGCEMTIGEMEEAYDNAVGGREAKRPSRETLVTYEEWMDSPHEEYEAGEGAYHPDTDYARSQARTTDTTTLQADYFDTRLKWLKKVIAGVLAERGVTVAEAK